MGKSIIVKDADFSRNSIGKIIDVSNLEIRSCSLGSLDAGWFHGGKHVLIEVSPGQTYYLKLSGVDVCYVGVLSSEHTEPVVNMQPISYAPAYSDRISINSGEYHKVTIPIGDAKYLAINVVSGDGVIVSWDVYMMYE